MKQTYPYYVAVKVSGGQLLKVYKDKKFKTYNECYDSLEKWAFNYPKSYREGQYAIVEYTSSYECKIVTIITNTLETKLV